MAQDGRSNAWGSDQNRMETRRDSGRSHFADRGPNRPGHRVAGGPEGYDVHLPQPVIALPPEPGGSSRDADQRTTQLSFRPSGLTRMPPDATEPTDHVLILPPAGVLSGAVSVTRVGNYVNLPLGKYAIVHSSRPPAARRPSALKEMNGAAQRMTSACTARPPPTPLSSVRPSGCTSVLPAPPPHLEGQGPARYRLSQVNFLASADAACGRSGRVVSGCPSGSHSL